MTLCDDLSTLRPVISEQYSSTLWAPWPGGAFARVVTIWEPMTTPSATLPTSTKCSRVLTPNPTAAGTPPEYVWTL